MTRNLITVAIAVLAGAGATAAPDARTAGSSGAPCSGSYARGPLTSARTLRFGIDPESAGATQNAVTSRSGSPRTGMTRPRRRQRRPAARRAHSDRHRDQGRSRLVQRHRLSLVQPARQPDRKRSAFGETTGLLTDSYRRKPAFSAYRRLIAQFGTTSAK